LLEENDIALLGRRPNGCDETPTRPQDAPDLSCRRTAVNDVHETERGQEGVKRSVAGWQLLSAAFAQIDVGLARLREALSCNGEHLRTDVDPGDSTGRPDKSGRPHGD
jgi:hypothetical protein